MNLTDTLYLTHLFFLYIKTAKAKQQRVFIKSKTLTYRTEKFYIILSLTITKSCKKSKKFSEVRLTEWEHKEIVRVHV